MAAVTLTNVIKRFGVYEIIHGANIDIADGEFVVFVGPSGCGKSTLLRMIAGLEDISGGEIAIGGKVMNDVEPAERGIAMVFQSYALYPHMSVEQNLSFGLRMTGNPKEDTERRVKRASEILRISELMARRPKQLSGGQRQRVAIGRAIVREPQVFLFDEPLSNLDAELRVHMRIEIARLHKELKTTIIYVTHDQVEAMTLADKIVVLRDGSVEQVGKPLTLYDDPDNLFVAGFIGSPKMNFLKGRIEGTQIRLPEFGGQTLPLTRYNLPPSESETVTVGIRPETFKRGGEASLALTIEIIEHLGGETFAYARQGDGQILTVAIDEGRDLRPGQQIAARFDAARALLFDSHGRRIR